MNLPYTGLTYPVRLVYSDDMSTATAFVRFGARPVQHFTGARPTHRTWQGVAEAADGARILCGHDGHRTAEAAAACARRAAR